MTNITAITNQTNQVLNSNTANQAKSIFASIWYYLKYGVRELFEGSKTLANGIGYPKYYWALVLGLSLISAHYLFTKRKFSHPFSKDGIWNSITKGLCLYLILYIIYKIAIK